MKTNSMFLKMVNISKNFPGVQALDNISFDLKVGEIHALVGENGAGKSTLMKILCGVYQQDAGEIYMNNDLVDIHTPRDAQEFGISIVHQELNLFPNLSVMENIFNGQMPQRGVLGFEDRKAAIKVAEDYLLEVDFSITPKTTLEG